MQRKFPILMLHGFTSSLDVIRKPAEKLTSSGFEVSTPILAGHGKTPSDLIGIKAVNWYEDAENSLLELFQKQGKVGLCGLSMGGLCAINLSINHPDKIHFLACSAPALKFASPLTIFAPVMAKLFKFWPAPVAFHDKKLGKKLNTNYPRFPTDSFLELYKWSKSTIKILDRITIPVFVQHSLKDQVVAFSGSRLLIEKASSREKFLKEYKLSGHEMFLDLESDIITSDLVAYIENFEMELV